MSLNLFRKVKLNCPVSADVARNRIRDNMEMETRWTLTAMPLLRLQSSGRRYMGVIKGNNFRLFVRPYIPSGHAGNIADLFYARNVTYNRDNLLAIKGTIEPTSTGCTVHLLFKPKGIFFVILPVWLAGLIFMTVKLYLKIGLEFGTFVPLMFIGGGLFMLRAFFFSSYALEKDYLEGLFTAELNPTDTASDYQFQSQSRR